MRINPDRYARAGIKIYAEDWKNEVSSMGNVGEVLETKNGFVVADPNGVWIYLENGSPGFEHETEPESFGLTGNYAGLSIEAHDIDKNSEIFGKANWFQNIAAAILRKVGLYIRTNLIWI